MEWIILIALGWTAVAVLAALTLGKFLRGAHDSAAPQIGSDSTQA